MHLKKDGLLWKTETGTTTLPRQSNPNDKEINMRILAVLILIGLAFDASATELKNIRANVQLQDKATNGCWTNLKETREYVERNLRMKGIQAGDFDVPDFFSNEFWLWIEVNAARTAAGHCTGYMSAELLSFFSSNDYFYTVSRHSLLDRAFIPSSDMNNYILDHMKSFFSNVR